MLMREGMLDTSCETRHSQKLTPNSQRKNLIHLALNFFNQEIFHGFGDGTFQRTIKQFNEHVQKPRDRTDPSSSNKKKEQCDSVTLGIKKITRPAVNLQTDAINVDVTRGNSNMEFAVEVLCVQSQTDVAALEIKVSTPSTIGQMRPVRF